MVKGLFLIPVICAILVSCKSEKEDQHAETDATEDVKVYDRWLIDLESVQSGCDRVDCIRSLDNPKFISVQEVDFLDDDDLVIGFKMGDEIKCYPHAILDYHEIINDVVDQKDIAINYCPLTGSGMAWNRDVKGKKTTFGVSGLLYNSNIIPYDRETRSAWSQMKQLCVNGEMADAHPETFQVVETNWATWKLFYPQSLVVSLETGMSRDYMTYPYYDYKEVEELMFDVEFENDTLFTKERLYGVIQNGKAKCYRFNNFKPGVQILKDTAFERNILLAGSANDNFIVGFENPGNRTFTPVKNKLPGIMQDEAGNIYDVFGYCIEGDKKGERLTPMNGFIAYWFAWYAFYPELKFE